MTFRKGAYPENPDSSESTRLMPSPNLVEVPKCFGVPFVAWMTALDKPNIAGGNVIPRTQALWMGSAGYRSIPARSAARWVW